MFTIPPICVLEHGTSNYDVRQRVAGGIVAREPWRLRGPAGMMFGGYSLAAAGAWHTGLPYSMRTEGTVPTPSCSYENWLNAGGATGDGANCLKAVQQPDETLTNNTAGMSVPIAGLGPKPERVGRRGFDSADRAEHVPLSGGGKSGFAIHEKNTYQRPFLIGGNGRGFQCAEPSQRDGSSDSWVSGDERHSAREHGYAGVAERREAGDEDGDDERQYGDAIRIRSDGCVRGRDERQQRRGQSGTPDADWDQADFLAAFALGGLRRPPFPLACKMRRQRRLRFVGWAPRPDFLPRCSCAPASNPLWLLRNNTML